MQNKGENISYAASIVALAYFEMQALSKSLKIKYYQDAATLGMIEGFQKNFKAYSQNDNLDLETVKSLSEGMINDLLKTELDKMYKEALAKIKSKDAFLKKDPESAMKIGRLSKNIEKKNRLHVLSNANSSWVDFLQSTEAFADTITAAGVISAYKSGEIIGSILAQSAHHIPLIQNGSPLEIKAKSLDSIYYMVGIMRSLSSMSTSVATLIPNTISDLAELALSSLSMIGIGLVESSLPISNSQSFTHQENSILLDDILSTGVGNDIVKEVNSIYEFQRTKIEKTNRELQKGFTEAIKENPGLAKRISKLNNYNSPFDILDKKISALKSSITASILYCSYQTGKSLGNLSKISNYLPSMKLF